MVKRLTDHVNLGWIRNDGAQADSTTWNLAAEYAHDAGVDLMAEVYRDDRRKLWYGTGVR